jgi:hypothetical protein
MPESLKPTHLATTTTAVNRGSCSQYSKGGSSASPRGQRDEIYESHTDGRTAPLLAPETGGRGATSEGGGSPTPGNTAPLGLLTAVAEGGLLAVLPRATCKTTPGVTAAPTPRPKTHYGTKRMGRLTTSEQPGGHRVQTVVTEGIAFSSADFRFKDLLLRNFASSPGGEREAQCSYRCCSMAEELLRRRRERDVISEWL